MVMHSSRMKHALSDDNGQSMIMFIFMDPQLSSSLDNGQSMIMYSSGIKHDLSEVNVS